MELGLFTGLFNARSLRTSGVPDKYKAKFKNEWEFRINFIEAVDRFLNMFKWKLPEGASAEANERTLLFEGRSIFFYDKALRSYLILPCILDHPHNVFYEYPQRKAVYPDGKTVTLTPENSVIIKNTPSMFPTVIRLATWAEKITDAGRTIDVYANSLKRPFILVASDMQKLSIEKVIEKVSGNEISVIINKESLAAMDGIEVITLTPSGQNYLSDLWSHKKNLINEDSESLGINTTQPDKKERLVVSEADANNQRTAINAANFLRERQIARDKINVMFPDADVDVTFNPEYGPVEEEYEEVEYVGSTQDD